MEDINVKILRQAEINTFNQVRDLISQLYPQRAPISFNTFKKVIEDGRVSIFIAVQDGMVIATSSLAHFEKLGGDKWIIEDFIVRDNMRGKGIGRRLINVMLDEAKMHGAGCVDVDTRAEEASLFYEACGFELKNKDRPLFSLRFDLTQNKKNNL